MPSESPTRVRTWCQIRCRKPFPAERVVIVSPWWLPPTPLSANSQALGRGSRCSLWGLSLPLQRRHGRFHSQRLLGPLPRPSSPDTGATESDVVSLDPQEQSFPVGCFEPKGNSYCRQPASCLHLAQLPDPTGFSCLSCLLFSIVSVSFSELHSTLPQNRPDPRCSEQEIFLPGSGRPHILLETANEVGGTSGQVPEGYQPPPHGGARPHRKGLGLCGYMGSIPWASWKAEQA